MSDVDEPGGNDPVGELLGADTVAVVGCSTTPGKAAHDVPRYLAHNGYRVIPVNPHAEAVLGEPAYDDVTGVDPDLAVDVVEVFRPSDEVPSIVDDVLARQGEEGDIWGLWLQRGITHDEALARATAAGLTTTQDRCMKVEHARL
ncbi:MAG: CoA-binding protein [Halolamina sp.]